jgi:hypothetical protein
MQDLLTSTQGSDTKKTSFVWQESLFDKFFNPKCDTVYQQLKQNKCLELIPVMGKAVQK